MKKTGTIALICALALSLMNAPAAGAWAVLPDGGYMEQCVQQHIFRGGIALQHAGGQ